MTWIRAMSFTSEKFETFCRIAGPSLLKLEICTLGILRDLPVMISIIRRHLTKLQYLGISLKPSGRIKHNHKESYHLDMDALPAESSLQHVAINVNQTYEDEEDNGCSVHDTLRGGMRLAMLAWVMSSLGGYNRNVRLSGMPKTCSWGRYPARFVKLVRLCLM